MLTEFNISCGRGQRVPVVSTLLEVKFILQNEGGSETLNGFDPRNDLVLGGIRIGHGLHESSYCYFKVYVGTFNLNISISIEQKRKLRN